MVRRGKVSCKRNFRKRVRSNEWGSDDSDEDYVVPDEGKDVSDGSEDYCFSLDEYASEESFHSFVEEEEVEGKRKFNRSKSKNGVRDQQKIGFKMSRKRGRITHVEEIQEKEENKDDDGYDVENGDEDYDYDEEEDEEFTPDEDDCSDEEENLKVRKKKNSMKTDKQVMQKNSSKRGQKRRRNSKVPKKPLGKKRRKNGGLTRKVKCDDESDFIDNGQDVRARIKRKSGRQRRLLVYSDSDFVSSGSPDYDYTISEEEREQVREAKELFGSLRTNLRSSSLPRKTEEGGDLCPQRKPVGRKGKEKLEEPLVRKGKEKEEDVKTEVGKQVCGICLSEEDKRRVRGVLNCCTHYFCFPCIMEWAKVESRCPLCKQRFTTISKPTRSTAGNDLREVVIQVPERDQVYQPSEEELRSYIDPYEYVICSECHEGGDDSLMLLCDLCDSPAHTFCVGLGQQVPEGNWYCDGCRPVALGSSSSQAQERVPDQRMTDQNFPSRSSPLVHVREGIDLNLMSSPHMSFSQGFGNFSSPRSMVRGVQVASPVSGGGAPTLSERRWIHRQIHQLLSVDRMNSLAGRINVTPTTVASGNNLFNSQIDQHWGTTPQQTRTPTIGTSYNTFFEERLCDNTSPLLQSRNLFPMRITNSRRSFIQDSATTSTTRTVNGMLWPGLAGTNTVSDIEQLHQCSSGLNIGTDGLPPFIVREVSDNHLAKAQVESIVESHLTGLPHAIDLDCLSSVDPDRSTFKAITMSSTHTILAACGLEHKTNEICTVPPPSVCPHIELVAGGQTSLIKGCCSSCFDLFVGDVVKKIMDTKISAWLSLGL
ncbi:PHD and RING finger domain-containing protein [Quillaja saponaria]|uniref:PHD and RING finger domain-containing protein n=1 Tax=Quillaja saponaria TaxID=32244 RepID=A0AAD7VJJ4_QUISA|nr:PHD and RING finger domain-containing protein [Quillaja saponaria]